MATIKKPTLRQLAVDAGLAKPNDLKLFQMDVDGLYELLKDEFPGIEELSESDVLELSAEAKKGSLSAKATVTKDEPRGRGRSKVEEPKDEPRGRGRSKVEEPKAEEPKDEPRGHGRGRSEDGAKAEEPKDEPRGRGRGRGRSEDGAKAEEPKDEPRGRGRSNEDVAPSGGDVGGLVKLLEAVLDGQVETGKRIDLLEKSIDALNAAVDASDVNTIKTLQGMKVQLAEVHAGVESLYLDDIKQKDTSLSDVLKRVSD